VGVGRLQYCGVCALGISHYCAPCPFLGE
jgi:hypothetical protein